MQKPKKVVKPSKFAGEGSLAAHGRQEDALQNAGKALSELMFILRDGRRRVEFGRIISNF